MSRDSSKYLPLVEHLTDAFAYHRIVTDTKGMPVDYVFLKVNTTFEEMSGLKRDKLIGKKATSVLPGIKESKFDWIGTYGQVALSGEPVCFESFSETLGRWYEVRAYSDNPGFFTTFYSEISDRKQREEQQTDLLSMQHILNSFMLELYKMNDYNELIKAVVTQIDQLLSPIITTFSEYDQDGRVLKMKELKTRHDILDLLLKIGGKKLLSIEAPVSDDMLQDMLANRLKVVPTLYEVSGGAIPKIVSNRLDKALEVKCYIGFSYLVDDQVFGTTVIALDKEPEYHLTELLKSYAHFISISLKRILSEQSLKTITLELKQITDNMSELITMTDTEGKITYISGKSDQTYGYTNDELLYRNARDIIYDEDLVRLTNLFSGSASTEQGSRAEYRVVHKDGSLVWVDTVNSLLFDNGNPNGNLLVTRDITKRKQAEQELNLQRERLANIVEAAKIATWEWNVQTGEQIINEKWADIIGYTVDEISPISLDTWIKYAHPDDLAISNQELEKHFNGEVEFYNVECRMLHKAGHWVWVNNRGKVIIWSEDGKPVWFFGTHIDITARKEAEAALAEEKEFLQVTLHSIGDGVLIIDTAEKITLINREAEVITGWSSTEAIGAPLSQVVSLFISDNHTALSDHPLELILREQHSDKAKHKKMQARDLQLKIVYCNAAPIRNKEGKPSGYVIVLKDMTDIQKMEAGLALAQKLESIGQLAAGIAHEINTPMQYISDNAHFLKEAFNHLAGACSQSMPTPEKPVSKAGDLEFYLKETPEAIAQTLEGIDHVGRIVAAMKNFSHSSVTGKKPADLNNAILNTLTVSRNEWKYVADINTEFDPQLPLVECNIGSINQVVLNMVLNAAHALKEATDTGLIEKGIIIVSTEAGPGTVRIKIADNGTGIDPLIIDKIFDPFFTTKEVGRGTGQGLMIAHDIIVNKHGGSITVHSEPGKGAEFTVTLPLG